MPAELLWSPQALEDLVDIYLTIAADSVDAAERIYTAIEARVGLLPDFPASVRADRRSHRRLAC